MRNSVSFAKGIIKSHPMTSDEETIYICANCIGESYLSEKVRSTGAERECHYCGESAEGIALDALADEIEIAFGTHYTRTVQDPNMYEMMMLRDKESNYEWDREGQETVDAIMDAAEIPEDAAKDVQDIL